MKGVLVVTTDAVAGRDDEFNDWYDNIHIPHVLAVPGFAAAQRFVAAEWRDGLPAQRYLALYELDVTVEQAMQSMRAARGTIPTPSDALDATSNVVYAYDAMGDRIIR